MLVWPSRRSGRDERGAAVVETVLVLPLLLGLMFATVGFGVAVVAKAVVTNAVRDSARLAAIECGQGNSAWWTDSAQAAADALGRGLSVGPLTATPHAYGQWAFTASCPDPGVPGDPVTVSLTYDEVNLFPPLAGLLGRGAAISPYFTLQASAVFPEE